MIKLALSLLLLISSTSARAAAPAEWTFLIFLNGHNSLDANGLDDINEMELVGSTARINVIVQWASLENATTKRLFIRKDSSGSNRVVSTVVQDLPRVDMGDYRALMDFVRWGVRAYPAQKYFVDVWNHGSGWHRRADGKVGPRDISADDVSGHSISTEELGLALGDAARVMGHPVDLYGSDACLMGMIEVASEVAPHVRAFVGSEDLEPGPGWPYDLLLERWNAMPSATPEAVAELLVQEYVQAMGEQITLSAFDLRQLAPLEQAIGSLGASLRGLPAAQMTKVKTATESAQMFAENDYRDLLDFVAQLRRQKVQVPATVLSSVESAAQKFIIENGASGNYTGANGIAIWLPAQDEVPEGLSLGSWNDLFNRYQGLRFNKNTSWSSFLSALVKH